MLRKGKFVANSIPSADVWPRHAKELVADRLIFDPPFRISERNVARGFIYEMNGGICIYWPLSKLLCARFLAKAPLTLIHDHLRSHRDHQDSRILFLYIQIYIYIYRFQLLIKLIFQYIFHVILNSNSSLQTTSMSMFLETWWKRASMRLRERTLSSPPGWLER